MKQRFYLLAIVCLIIMFAAACTTVESVTNTLVELRYGTPPPTVDPSDPLTDPAISLLANETVEPLPTFTPTITATPLPTATPTSTPTATPIPQIVSYRDQLGRFDLSYPDNWLFNGDDEAAIFFASDEQALTTNNLETGGVMFVFPGEVNSFETPDAAGILRLFIDSFVVFDSEEIIQPVTTATVNGQAAAVATADAVFNRYSVQVSYTAIVAESQFVVVVTMLANESAADFQPIVRGMIESINLP